MAKYSQYYNEDNMREIYDRFNYTDDLMVKYSGIVLVVQYKLSYTRENRIQV